MTISTRNIIFLASTFLLLCPVFFVEAQLSSTNYTVDSYVIGEGAFSAGTSTNFTSDFGVSNFIYDAPASSNSQSSGGGGGSNISLVETKEPVSTSTPTDSEGVDTDKKTNTQPTPYVPPFSDGYVQVPKTINEARDKCAVIFHPTYREGDQVSEPESISYYAVLNNDQEVKLTMPSDAFLIPRSVDNKNQDYSVCISFQDHSLPWQQKPDPQYGVILVQNRVYTLSAIDSEGKVVQRFNSPVTIAIDTNGTIDRDYQVSGYEFDKKIAVWYKLNTNEGIGDELNFSIWAPALFGLWQGENLPERMLVEIGSGDPESKSIDSNQVNDTDQAPPLFDQSLIILVALLILILVIILILLSKLRGSKNHHPN